jgi:hypothetical protein
MTLSPIVAMLTPHACAGIDVDRPRFLLICDPLINFLFQSLSHPEIAARNSLSSGTPRAATSSDAAHKNLTTSAVTNVFSRRRQEVRHRTNYATPLSGCVLEQVG